MATWSGGQTGGFPFSCGHPRELAVLPQIAETLKVLGGKQSDCRGKRCFDLREWKLSILLGEFCPYQEEESNCHLPIKRHQMAGTETLLADASSSNIS